MAPTTPTLSATRYSRLQLPWVLTVAMLVVALALVHVWPLSVEIWRGHTAAGWSLVERDLRGRAIPPVVAVRLRRVDGGRDGRRRLGDELEVLQRDGARLRAVRVVDDHVEVMHAARVGDLRRQVAVHGGEDPERLAGGRQVVRPRRDRARRRADAQRPAGARGRPGRVALAVDLEVDPLDVLEVDVREHQPGAVGGHVVPAARGDGAVLALVLRRRVAVRVQDRRRGARERRDALAAGVRVGGLEHVVEVRRAAVRGVALGLDRALAVGVGGRASPSGARARYGRASTRRRPWCSPRRRRRRSP